MHIIGKMNSKQNNLIWIDLEMTGLVPEQDFILEIAAVITDSLLNIVAEGPEIVLHQPDEILSKMDDWNKKQHTKSGLLDLVKVSEITEKQAELQVLQFLEKYVDRDTSPICGNTIYQDRQFLCHHMPNLEKYFHYRQLDVSTIKILAQRWVPDLLFQRSEEESNHRAKDDVLKSIKELKFYKKEFFRLAF